jgi:hypothetical protein
MAKMALNSNDKKYQKFISLYIEINNNLNINPSLELWLNNLPYEL